MKEEIRKKGHRYELWLVGCREFLGHPHLHSVGYGNENGAECGMVRWGGMGRLIDTYWSDTLHFLFNTSEHVLSQDEVETALFWETMIGLRHLPSSMPMSRIINETSFVDMVGRTIRTLWKKAQQNEPIPGLTISPFKFEYDKQRGLYAISPDNYEQLFIKTSSAA
jgi:hypothetical protein